MRISPTRLGVKRAEIRPEGKVQTSSKSITSIATLTLLGTATSQGIPVIGCTCPACRSSDPRDKRLRTSALLIIEESNINIDAGPDFRLQMLSNGVKHLEGIILTHEHNDHTAGIDDVRPYCFMQRMDMPVYSLPRVAQDLKDRFAYAFTDYPGVPRLDIREVAFGDTLRIGTMRLEFLEVFHGKLPIIGFRVGGLAYLTDVKTLPQATLARLSGLDTLIISCLNFRGTHSHLSVEEALAYASQIAAKRTILTHLSHRLGTHAEFQASLPEGVEVGYDGMVIQIH